MGPAATTSGWVADLVFNCAAAFIRSFSVTTGRYTSRPLFQWMSQARPPPSSSMVKRMRRRLFILLVPLCWWRDPRSLACRYRPELLLLLCLPLAGDCSIKLL